jgi:hypothetical protein
MVERQLPKLHTGVRFPSPAFFLIEGWAFNVGSSVFSEGREIDAADTAATTDVRQSEIAQSSRLRRLQ